MALLVQSSSSLYTNDNSLLHTRKKTDQNICTTLGCTLCESDQGHIQLFAQLH